MASGRSGSEGIMAVWTRPRVGGIHPLRTAGNWLWYSMGMEQPVGL